MSSTYGTVSAGTPASGEDMLRTIRSLRALTPPRIRPNLAVPPGLTVEYAGLILVHPDDYTIPTPPKRSEGSGS